ncbi:hypothetical protein K457DRAFT_16376 [Linnemannia elongata AG-77]|uniref:C2 domain-containing protein n=1 Tax=Linnemannia elongata AG-77 TaxID=1314771 RepID=A0A197K5A9_9FUNG|nr:hypothetical protein K457DRAFT_16376 [Linnemannia elongata AG-77]
MLSLSSIQEKISSLVHRHKNTASEVVEAVQEVTIPTASKNWDFSITFVGGKDVPRGDILSSDPFLEAYLGNPEDPLTLSFITGVHWNTLNPVWDAKWELLNVTDETELILYIKDKDKMKEDTPLGKAVLILGAKLEGSQEHELDIVRPDGRTHGKVIVHTTGTRSYGKSTSLSKPTTAGPVRYSRHTSYAAGVLTAENRKFEFYAYRLRLYHLYDIFGTDPSQYNGWNKGYAAAQKIFGDNYEGSQIRQALHNQHGYLYRHGRTTQYNAVANGTELGALLHGERLKKDPEQDLKMVVFTYSIVPKGMYFSETGAAFFQDFMSKHAMHANRATEVMFSGEFRVFRDEHHHDDWTLMIDNNSGTYSPRKEDLPKVKKLFEANFPGLTVITLDHEDPVLKDIRAETKRIEAETAARQKQRFSLFSSMSSKSDEPSSPQEI